MAVRKEVSKIDPNPNTGGGLLDDGSGSFATGTPNENPVIGPTDPNILDPLPDGDRTYPDVQQVGHPDPVTPDPVEDPANQYPFPSGTPSPKIPGSPGLPRSTEPGLLDVPELDLGIEATTREVTDDELASTQLNKLLSGDSEYIRQARQEGLELGGGLGGSMGIRSAIGEATRRAGPIAIADAQAYRDAAAQNMDALNEFGLANINRATQLQLGTLDANTRLKTTWMNNMSAENIARMQDITLRDISNADNATKLKITEINGAIQAALAQQEYQYSQVLNDQLHANQLEDISLQGEYNLAQEEMRLLMGEQATYTQSYMAIYEGALDRIAALNGLDIDDAAIARSTDAIWEGFYGSVALLQSLYPDADPIEFE